MVYMPDMLGDNNVIPHGYIEVNRVYCMEHVEHTRNEAPLHSPLMQGKPQKLGGLLGASIFEGGDPFCMSKELQKNYKKWDMHQPAPAGTIPTKLHGSQQNQSLYFPLVAYFSLYHMFLSLRRDRHTLARVGLSDSVVLSCFFFLLFD